jgi:hypothetical protein
VKQATRAAKHTARTAKPATRVAKQATRTAKPATRVAKPATRTAKPATRAATPAARTAKPAPTTVSWLAAAAVIVATGLGGCGFGATLRTAASPPGATVPTSVTQTRSVVSTGTDQSSGVPRVRTNELPTTPGPEERAQPAASAQLALRRFASLYINWNAADVRARLDELAADSVGQARTAMQLQAAQTAADSELREAGIANHGKVEAVTPLTGSGARYVVITLETTSATDSSAYQGLAAAWHLTVATVARRGGGWVISGWQPES